MGTALELGVAVLLVALGVLPAARTALGHPLLLLAALRSFRRHLRQGLAVALTAAVATSVIAGALVVGDSMQSLVDETATQSLPGIDAVIRATRPVATTYLSSLAQDPAWTDSVAKGAYLLTVPAAVTCGRTGLRDGQSTVFGIESSVYGLSSFTSGGDARTAVLSTGEAAINRHMAEQTGARVGDLVTVRVPNPGFWGDFLFLFGEDASVVRHLQVKAVFDDEGLGRLDLDAKRTPSSAIFVNLAEAQDLLGVKGKVNAVLMQWRDRGIVGTDREDRVVAQLEGRLDAVIDASAVGLELQTSPGGWKALVSDGIFIQGSLEPELAGKATAWSPTLTYFVDSLESRDGNRLSYSTIAGIDFEKDLAAFGDWSWNGSRDPGSLQENRDEIVLNNWTAEALGINPRSLGSINVTYTVVDERYHLVQRSVSLSVVGVVNLNGKADDPALMPPIPGIDNVVSCLDWHPPFPMNISTIGPADVAYWNAHRGTPKGWVDLETARRLWANPDGNWTGARFLPANATLKAFEGAVGAADAGLSIVPARAKALATAGPLGIFEEMFAAFGAVLVLAGCLLESTAFGNLARARLRDHATLRALGLTRAGLVRLLVLEGTLWGILAGIIGTMAGAALGAGLVWGLNGVWAAAVQGAQIPLAIGGASLGLAFGAGLLVTVVTLMLAARQAARADLATTLADRSGGATDKGLPGRPRDRSVAAVAIIAFTLIAWSAASPASDVGGIAMFFTVGLVVTLGAILLLLPLAPRFEHALKKGGLIAPWRMGLRSLGRRPRRTAVLLATFAVVSFAVIGISWAGQVEVSRAGEASSRTGGYDVIAETWVQAGTDLKTSPNAPPGNWSVTPVKVVGAQGGTCSNLNARFPPRVMGMPDEFLQRSTVGFRSTSAGDDRHTWRLLNGSLNGGRIPIVVDYNTLVWVYGGELGHVYKVTGDRGRSFDLEVVGVMEGSIFAGSFITAQRQVEEMFPDSAAYTYFLFRSGSTPPGALADELEVAFGDLGLDARETEQVVRDNLGYELSFLSLFQAYLALGLVIGAVGLGALAARGVRERRREIGTMRALGWPRQGVGFTFLAEQLWVAGAGLVAGLLGAAVAVLMTTPSWLGGFKGLYFPLWQVATVVAAVLAAAGASAALSAWGAARTDVVEALRVVE